MGHPEFPEIINHRIFLKTKKAISLKQISFIITINLSQISSISVLTFLLLLIKKNFTPTPCTYITLPLDGRAKNHIIIFYLHGYARSRNLSCLDPFLFLPPIPEGRKNIWSELESNPGPHASQATTLTTRP